MADISNLRNEIYDCTKELISTKNDYKKVMASYKTKIKTEEVYIEKLSEKTAVDDEIKKIIADSYSNIYDLQEQMKSEALDYKDRIKEIEEKIRSYVDEIKNS